jgi:hypothetical protein
LFFNEKESEKRDMVFRKIYDMKKYQKILFDILQYCDSNLNHNIIQLNLLKEHIDKIRYEKLDGDSNKDDQQLVEDLIKYQNDKRTKFITFPKTFLENYYNYFRLNPGIENKIDKLYDLLKLYGELESDDSEYKEILSENIHKIKESEIKEESIIIKEQLEYLFKKDPYYIHEYYKKKEIQKYIKK